MNKNEIMDTVITIVRKHAKSNCEEEIVCDKNLLEYGIDSLVAVRIIVELEELLDMEIPNEYVQFEKINSVNKLVECVGTIL